MRPKLKILVVLCLLGIILLAVVMVRSEPILNWFVARSLHSEKDAKKRVVLINTTLRYAPEYWNREYLREALRADTQWERRFLAELIRERFHTNATQELQSLLTQGVPESSKSNVIAVISELQRLPQ